MKPGRSTSAVCGQAQAHQIRPKRTVTSRKAKARKSVAARTTKSSSIHTVAPKTCRWRVARSKRSALSPFTRRNGRPSARAACASSARRRHDRIRGTGEGRPDCPSTRFVVILEHLVLRLLHLRSPAPAVVVRHDGGEERHQRRSEEQVGESS